MYYVSNPVSFNVFIKWQNFIDDCVCPLVLINLYLPWYKLFVLQMMVIVKKTKTKEKNELLQFCCYTDELSIVDQYGLLSSSSLLLCSPRGPGGTAHDSFHSYFLSPVMSRLLVVNVKESEVHGLRIPVKWKRVCGCFCCCCSLRHPVFFCPSSPWHFRNSLWSKRGHNYHILIVSLPPCSSTPSCWPCCLKFHVLQKQTEA